MTKSMTKYCSECGCENKLDTRFCADCGTEFKTVTTVGPSFCGAFGSCMKRYFKVRGRATRSEYWGWLVVYGIVSAVLGVAVVATFQNEEMAQYARYALGACAGWFALTLIPGLALAARRLHDANKSGWTLWVPLVFCAAAALAFVYGVKGNLTFDQGTLQNLCDPAKVKGVLTAYWEHMKTNSFTAFDFGVLASGALGVLATLLLALRLCFAPGTAEANRYGDKQINP